MALTLRSYMLQSWVIIMPYALRAMFNTASFSHDSATNSKHCLLAWVYSDSPVNVDKSTPVDESNIDDPVSPQISSKSDVKSTLNNPNDVLDEFVDVVDEDLLFPDNKSLISFSISAAALVSRLIACSPSDARYMAATSSADRPTAAKLLSSNCANKFNASSIAASVLRNSSYRALQTQRRYWSFVVAQN